MGQTLENGIYLPSEGERNCYDGLASNWRALDSHLGNADIHVTYADKQAWNDHVADTVKHVTAEDKAKWDAVTSKADDSDVVHKSGNETIDGNKKFNGDTNCVGELNQTAPFKMTSDTSFVTGSKNTSIYDQNGFQCVNESIIYNNSRNIRRTWTVNNNSSGTTVSAGFNFILSASGQKVFYPISDSDTDNGSSSAYWKSTYTKKINALEPSSLSLPSGTVTEQIDISSYFSNTGSGNTNSYTASANGWIYLYVTACKTLTAYIQSTTDTLYSDYRERSSDGQIRVMLPIQKNNRFTSQWTTSSAVLITKAVFIPCQGNV